MARMRSLKPEFWDDRKLAKATSRDARMLYMGLWNQADEHSRCNGDPLWLKGRIFPYDDDITPEVVADLLRELAKSRRIRQYEVDSDPYLLLLHLDKHQRLEPKVESRLPAPPPAGTDGPEPDPPDPACDAGSSARDADEPGQVRASRARAKHVAGSMEHVAGKNPSSDAPQRADVDRVCQHLADRITANGSKRPPITARWRTAARLLLDNDRRTEEQIHAAIDWCQDDQFWRSNIMSMPKLREKFDQLRLAAQRTRASPPNGRITPDQRIADIQAMKNPDAPLLQLLPRSAP